MNENESKRVETHLRGGEEPEDILGKTGRLKTLTKELAQRIESLQRALTEELTRESACEADDALASTCGHMPRQIRKIVRGGSGDLVREASCGLRRRLGIRISGIHQSQRWRCSDEIYPASQSEVPTRKMQGHLMEGCAVDTYPFLCPDRTECARSVRCLSRASRPGTNSWFAFRSFPTVPN